MRIIKLVFQGLVLSGTVLIGLVMGDGLSKLLRVPSLLMIQLLGSATFSIILFLGFTWLLKKVPASSLLLQTRKEYWMAYLISFIWTPVLFIPGYYLLVGSVPNLSNIILAWWFQFAVGLISAMLTAAVFKAEGTTRRPRNRNN